MIRNIKMVENGKKREKKDLIGKRWKNHIMNKYIEKVKMERYKTSKWVQILEKRSLDREIERDRRRWSKAIRREVINLKWSVRVVKS